jgi:hypothetical protein
MVMLTVPLELLLPLAALLSPLLVLVLLPPLPLPLPLPPPHAASSTSAGKTAARDLWNLFIEYSSLIYENA